MVCRQFTNRLWVQSYLSFDSSESKDSITYMAVFSISGGVNFKSCPLLLLLEFSTIFAIKRLRNNVFKTTSSKQRLLDVLGTPNIISPLCQCGISKLQSRKRYLRRL